MGYIYLNTNCARAQARVATKKIPKCRPDLEATPPDAQNTRAHKNSVIYYTIWQIAEPRLALAAANREKKKKEKEKEKEKEKKHRQRATCRAPTSSTPDQLQGI